MFASYGIDSKLRLKRGIIAAMRERDDSIKAICQCHENVVPDNTEDVTWEDEADYSSGYDASSYDDYPTDEEVAEATAGHSAIEMYGVPEVAGVSLNSIIGCSAGNCRYCYAASSALENKYIHSRDAWQYEKVKTKLPDFNEKCDGVVTYPSNHDICMKHIGFHKEAIKQLLEAGNQIIICTKPRIGVIDQIDNITRRYKDQVTFNISVSTLDEDKSIFFEPLASLPQERLSVLEVLHHAGYKTIVSVEPLLGGPGEALGIYNAVIPFITEYVAFGTMNFVEKRLDMTNPDNVKAAAAIKRYSSPENIEALVWILKDHYKVKFKNSILRYF